MYRRKLLYLILFYFISNNLEASNIDVLISSFPTFHSTIQNEYEKQQKINEAMDLLLKMKSEELVTDNLELLGQKISKFETIDQINKYIIRCKIIYNNYKNDRLKDAMDIIERMNKEGMFIGELPAIQAIVSSYTIPKIIEYINELRTIYDNYKSERLKQAMDLLFKMKSEGISIGELFDIQAIIFSYTIPRIIEYINEHRTIYNNYKNDKLNEAMDVIGRMNREGIFRIDLSAIRVALSSYKIPEIIEYANKYRVIFRNYIAKVEEYQGFTQ